MSISIHYILKQFSIDCVSKVFAIFFFNHGPIYPSLISSVHSKSFQSKGSDEKVGYRSMITRRSIWRELCMNSWF